MAYMPLIFLFAYEQNVSDVYDIINYGLYTIEIFLFAYGKLLSCSELVTVCTWWVETQ